MAQTLLYGDLESELAGASVETGPSGRWRLWIPLGDLERATGWTAKPEGLCRAETCVPVPAARRADWIEGDRFDFAAFATHLGHTVARDETRGLWSFGPPADRGPGGPGSIVDADLRLDIRLPDLDGTPRSLSDHRGKKVLLYGWSSW